MTEQTATEATDLRKRTAKSLATHAGSKAFLNNGYEWDHSRSIWYAHADAAIAAVQPELDRLADYENRITWETSCGACARVLDSSIKETERAEKAEAALREVLDAFEAYWAQSSYDGPAEHHVVPEQFESWRKVLQEGMDG